MLQKTCLSNFSHTQNHEMTRIFCIKLKWASNLFQIVESASGEQWNFLFATKHNEVSLFSSLWQLQHWNSFKLVPTFLLSALAWTQRRMKIVTLLFENQTKWMIKIKRVLMLAEVRNKKMWFISIQLFFSLKRDLFKKLVQKSHNFSEIHKNLSFH